VATKTPLRQPIFTGRQAGLIIKAKARDVMRNKVDFADSGSVVNILNYWNVEGALAKTILFSVQWKEKTFHS
jgi:hypothetical protein